MKLPTIAAVHVVLGIAFLFMQPAGVATTQSGTVDFDGFSLVITGTGLNDTLIMDSLSNGGLNLRLNGAQHRVEGFPEIIEIHLGDGDDRFVNNMFFFRDIVYNVYGQAGNDTLHDREGVMFLSGGSGDDTLISSASAPKFLAEMSGGSGNDELYAGPGSLFAVSGGSGDDMIFGGGGDDNLGGGPGDDIVYGGSGSDTITGDGGEDMLFGGRGTDFINLGFASTDTVGDIAYGGPGDDLIDGSPFDDIVYGGAGEDSVFGYGGDDSIIGGSDRDYLYGGPGDDYISCGAGDDVADGEGGTDMVYGNTGDDDLTGSGADVVRQ